MFLSLEVLSLDTAHILPSLSLLFDPGTLSLPIKSSSIKELLPVQCLPTPTGDEIQDLAHAKQELHPAPSSMT